MKNCNDNLINSIFRLCVCLAVLLPLAGCMGTGRSSDEIDTYERKNLEIAAGFLSNGYPQKAISRLEKVIKRNGHSYRIYGMLGVVYQQQGEYTLAENSFEKALDLNGDASDIYNNYGTLLFKMGRYDEAGEAFEKATQDIYYDHRSRAFENLGFVALKKGNKEEAKKRFARALRLEPNLASSSLELARIYFFDGRYSEAFKYFQVSDASGQLSSKSLWLGIRIARAVDKTDLANGYVSTLKKRYPDSDEYRQYRRRYND